MSRRTLALVALAGLLLSALWLWSQGDERRIDRNLKRIQKLVAKGPGESRFEGLRRAQEITGLFADSFAVEAEPLDFASRDRRSLAAGIHQYRSFSSQISMRIRDREHSVDGRLGRATTYLTAEFLTSLGDALTGREIYRLQINWVEQAGDWRIDYVRLLEVIESPGWNR